MRSPRLTIIILNFNGLEDTINCINSVLKIKYPNFKAIVVDNGSKINEAKILAEKFNDKRIKFLRFSKNFGFSGGNNRVLKKIKDKYVVLLNNDTEVTPGWLTPLVETLENDPKIAVVQPKILWLTNRKYFDYAGASGGFIDIFGYPFTRGRIFNTKELDKGQYDNQTDIFWASGAAMIIRKSVFDKVGYFDEQFFNYMEEIDLCFRIHRVGLRVVCNPKSVIFHKGAASSSGNEMKKRFWEHRNNLLLITKNYPLNILAFIMPARLILEYISFLYYLLTSRYTYAIAVIWSQFSFTRIMPVVIFNRLKSKKFEEHSINNQLYEKSIIVKYFILKKRKYSDIIH